MTVALIAAEPRHIGRIAARMRECDRIEVGAHGRTPKHALRRSLSLSSLAWTATVDGLPEAMLGVAPLSILDSRGSPWMLGTDEVMRHPRALLEWGPMLVDAMVGQFARLENMVAAGNVKAVRLLIRLGFTVMPWTETVSGVPFRRFQLGE